MSAFKNSRFQFTEKVRLELFGQSVGDGFRPFFQIQGEADVQARLATLSTSAFHRQTQFQAQYPKDT